MKRIASISVFVFALFAGVSCVHENPQPTGDGTGGNDTTGNGGGTSQPCDPDTVYFQNDILPLFVSNCAMSGCHDAQTAEDGVILTDYQTIMQTGEIDPGNPNNSEVYEAITETDPDKIMPPPPATLTPEQIAMVYTWIAQGAQNNGCGDCDTTNVTYSGIIRSLVDQWCVGCHGGIAPSDGIDLSTYTGLYNIALNGSLIGSTHGQSGYSPMPQGGQLSDCEKDQLLIWVQDGAPNN
jgi:mono/diheme cytochrome c family protein